MTSLDPQIRIVAESAAERRMADRLSRAGLTLAVVPPAALAQSAPQGALYILTAERAAGTDLPSALRAGMHVWLIPPWPAISSNVGGHQITLTPAMTRDLVHLARAVVESLPAGQGFGHGLRILYRERLAISGALSLAESGAGELFVAALPRASNLYGLLLVTTLMVGTASAQTDLDDLTLLVRAIASWCLTQQDSAPGTSRQEVSPPEPDVANEMHAQRVLLALMLSAPRLRQATAVRPQSAATPSDIRHRFEEIGHLLGADCDESAFAVGWDWLQSRAVILDRGEPNAASGATEANVVVDVAAAQRYIQLWQLDPWMRRLSALTSQRELLADG